MYQSQNYQNALFLLQWKYKSYQSLVFFTAEKYQFNKTDKIP